MAGFHNIFIDEADRSAARSKEGAEASLAPIEAGGAAAAILLAAAGCEAWMSEFIALAEEMGGDDAEPFLDLRRERDAARQFGRLFSLRSPDYDLGSSTPYQQLGCLFKLRDHVAHRGARFLSIEAFPERLADCVRQKSIPVRDEQGHDWTSITLVHEVAHWAVEAARGWLRVVEAEIGSFAFDDVELEIGGMDEEGNVHPEPRPPGPT